MHHTFVKMTVPPKRLVFAFFSVPVIIRIKKKSGNSITSEVEELIVFLRKTVKQQGFRVKEQEMTISELRAMITGPNSSIVNFNETLDELRRRCFGTSSEKALNPTAGETITVKDHAKCTSPKKHGKTSMHPTLSGR